jgi:phage terminase large subunit-like protein
VYPQGIKPLYRMTFDSGIEIRCCGEHLWKVMHPAARFSTRWSRGKIEPNPRFGQWEVLRTEQILETSGPAPKPRRRFLTPFVNPVQFEPRAVALDPYLMGLMLGDGSMTGAGVSISTEDQDIVQCIAGLLPDHMQLVQANRLDWRISVKPDGPPARGRNEVINALRHYGLMGKGSADKFVPDDYLYNTPEVRLAVLQGLMDTDGSISKDGAVEFTTISTCLRDAVEFLVRSFGGKTKTTVRSTTYSHNGEVKNGKPSYRIRIRLPHVAPFRLARKLERIVRPVSTCDEHVIHTIEPIEAGPATCIEVDHPDRTFVTEGFIVTHNTWSSAYEIAYHLTGLYPDWWEGKKWARGVTGWALGESMESTRDTLQRLVMGRPGEWGTGTIPADLIIDVKRGQGVADTIDCVYVRHASSLVSRLYFKSYEKGRSKLQGETLDFAALDEEPPLDIYTEVLTRTNATRGIVWITFTPLLGMSDVVRRFLQTPTPDTIDVNMTIDDVDHYTKEDRERIVSSYPAHEREARALGVPILGSGRVFPIEEAKIKVDAFQIPDHWPIIAGIDFGIDHYTAVAWLAWDRDKDTIYLYDAIRERQKTPKDIAPLIKVRGEWVPMAWPHDGLQTEKGSGIQLAQFYRDESINMLYEKASLPETGAEDGHQNSKFSVEAGVLLMLQYMQAGKFKVFSHLNDFWEEFRLYHRKDGKIVKEQDDLISATRYAFSMRRFAQVAPDPTSASMDPSRPTDWWV